jgi:hypothetical protein
MILSSMVTILSPFGIQSAAIEPRLEERLMARVPAELALEGKPIRSPDGIEVPVIQTVTWSPDGAQVGYVGLKGEVPWPVLGEQTFKAYDYASGPVFGRDGTHSAFRVGKRVTKDRERWWVLLDGKEVGAQDWIGEVALAPDGGSFAAWTQPGANLASDGSYARGRQVLVTPWKAGAKWDDADSLMPPRFAPDGSFVTALASKAGGWRFICADKKGERDLSPPQPFLLGYDVSADAKNFALVVPDMSSGDPAAGPPMSGMSDMKCTIVFGKQSLGRDADGASSPRLSPDGKQLAWIFREGALHGVAIGDGKRRKAEHRWIRELTFGPDGKELVFASGKGGTVNTALVGTDGQSEVEGAEWGIVHRDSSGSEKSGTESFRRVANFTWSRDGSKLAFAAKTPEGWCIVCGEQRSATFDEVGEPHFAADGLRVAFGARQGRELWWKVLAVAK